jgi:fanconi anemia group M protein
MVEKALFTNSLIALPTGLGKTFIAAVVMYNYFRWFPEGNVLFSIVTVTSPMVYFMNSLRKYMLRSCYLINGNLGKIIFAAPSRPLVAQQIEACYNTVGIPQVLQ